jgi:hypothetical protein
MISLPEVRQHIDAWIDDITKPREELGGNKICPYASKNYTISYGFDIPNDIKTVHMCLMGNTIKQDDIKRLCDKLNNNFDDLIFLPDHKENNGNIKGILTGNRKYNIILVQPKKKLRQFRESLVKTDYYTYWSDEYLREILEEDYELLDRLGST